MFWSLKEPHISNIILYKQGFHEILFFYYLKCCENASSSAVLVFDLPSGGPSRKSGINFKILEKSTTFNEHHEYGVGITIKHVGARAVMNAIKARRVNC